MDVSVANLSAGQRKIAETKEKTKNILGCTAKIGTGMAATLGVAELATSVDTFELEKGIKGKVLSKFAKGFEGVYDSMTSLFKKMYKNANIADFTAKLKDMPKATKGGLIATVAVGTACVLNSIITATKAKEKSKQIEQKYN